MTVPLFGSKEKVSFLRSTGETIRTLQGLGREATAKGVESLASLTSSHVAMESSGAYLVPTRGAAAALRDAFADARTLSAMTYDGDVHGFGVLALDEKTTRVLVDLLLGQPTGTTEELGELEQSAVAETANIALNQMVTAAAAKADASMATGVPDITFDPPPRIDALCAANPAGTDHAIIIETTFAADSAKVRGQMGLVFFTTAEQR